MPVDTDAFALPSRLPPSMNAPPPSMPPWTAQHLNRVFCLEDGVASSNFGCSLNIDGSPAYDIRE